MTGRAGSVRYPPRLRPRHRRRAHAAAMCCAALLAACAPANDDPSAVTADEDRQLNQAAAQLDEALNATPAGVPTNAALPTESAAP